MDARHPAPSPASPASSSPSCSPPARPRRHAHPAPTPSRRPTAAPRPHARHRGADAAPLFPVELTDDEGTAVALPAEPTKIVSLTPAATETLFALGVGDRLVGKVEDFTPYPEAAAAIPDVAKFGSVDVEKIVSLGAELVIAGGDNFNPPEAIEQLRDLGVPVLVVFAPDVEGALADIELIGRAVGRPDEAAAVNAEITAAFDEVKAATEGRTPVRTFYELDASHGLLRPGARLLRHRDDPDRRRRPAHQRHRTASTRSRPSRSSRSTRRSSSSATPRTASRPSRSPPAPAGTR